MREARDNGHRHQERPETTDRNRVQLAVLKESNAVFHVVLVVVDDAGTVLAEEVLCDGLDTLEEAHAHFKGVRIVVESAAEDGFLGNEVGEILEHPAKAFEG
jgi:hypothetical protein